MKTYEALTFRNGKYVNMYKCKNENAVIKQLTADYTNTLDGVR